MIDPERPPLFKHWNTWYWLVFGFMVLQVVFYSILTYSFQ